MKTIVDALIDPTECDFVDVGLRPLQAIAEQMEQIHEETRRASIAEAQKIEELSRAFFDESIAELLDANRQQRPGR